MTRDLHANGPVGVMTDYEEKFHAQGLPIYRCVGTMEADWTEPFPETAREVRSRWLEAFGAGVPDEILEGHVYPEGNFLWHIFTWGKVPCLTGDAAEAAVGTELVRAAEAAPETAAETNAEAADPGAETAKPEAASAELWLFCIESPPGGVPLIRRVEDPGAFVPPATDGIEGADWYLTDRNFTWTYVHTHESELGPYFCRRA